MGLRPVLGRLLDAVGRWPQCGGRGGADASLLDAPRSHSDPTVVGKTIRLGARTATVIGVLEPSVPYPADTEIIANMVTSPHHLGATMVTAADASHDGAVRPPGARRDARRRRARS